MPDNSANNKRIAKNTFALYFRMVLILVVTLYTSRVVLAYLGVVDYGVYNVVGGVVLMFSFINSSMSTSTQRFLTFELGKKDYERLRRTFAASLNVHIFLGLVIVILAESIGLWFVNTHLVIPPDRLFAANIVYQCSIMSFFISITQVPYNASLIAHEKMNIYAYLSVLEALGKLGIVMALKWYHDDRLIFYAILILVFQLLMRVLYRAYCIRHYEECRFSLFWDRGLYKALTSFAGWNLFGSIAWLLRGQGVNILLNMFFGPVLNAAKGIADKVSASVTGFISNFNIAMNPQITKHYAEGDIYAMGKLCCQGTKFSFCLLFFLSLPAIINIDFILNLWLVEVPDYTIELVVLILIDALVNSLFGSSQFITAMMATGKIRNYQIVVGVMIMMIVPVAYICLYNGGSPMSVVYSMIGVSIVSDIARILFCRHQIGFSVKRLAKTVWLPSLMMVLLSVPVPYYIRNTYYADENWSGFIVNSLICVFFVAACSWFIAMNKNERKTISTFILVKLRKSKNG